jgi:hypothetical protein
VRVCFFASYNNVRSATLDWDVVLPISTEKIIYGKFIVRKRISILSAGFS